MNIFETLMRVKGYPLRKAEDHIADVHRQTPSERIDYQEAKKWEIFQHHLANNSFYRNRVGESVQQWSDVPVLKRADLHASPVEGVLCDGIRSADCHRGHTSGSSGSPLNFAKDKYCHAITWACILAYYRAIGIRYGQDYQLRVWGLAFSGRTRYVERLKDRLCNRNRIMVYDPSDDIIDRELERLRTHRFNHIYGYANSVKVLARRLQARGEALTDICPTVTSCIVTSEVCTEEDRALISSAFGVPVYNEYGACELAVLAMDSPEERWSLNTAELFLEFLDEDDQPVEEGERGRIVVTSLYNRAMPFIRYEIGDCGAYSNGGRTLERLEGRLNDLVYCPSGRTALSHILNYINKAVTSQCDGVIEYRVKQPALDELEFSYVMDRDVSPELVATVTRVVHEQLEPSFRVSVRRVDRLDRTAAGKFNHFERLSEPPRTRDNSISR